MRLPRALLLIALGSTAAACGGCHHGDTASAPPPSSNAAPERGGPKASEIGTKEILVVSFFSPGNGVDDAAQDRLASMLKTLPQVPPFVSHLWGKEGEDDECFDLSKLSTADRGAFVSRVNEAVQPSTKVKITENGVCHEGR